MEQEQGEGKTKRTQKDSRDSPRHGLVGVFIPNCSRLGLLTDLDAARRPSAPRPQRGPRRRRRPSPPPVPRPTPVTSTTWRLQPPSRIPSPLAPSIQEWTPQLPPDLSSGPGCPSPPSTARSIGHSTSTAALRRHSTPVYLQSKDQAHDHTARLIIHSSQIG